MNLVTGATGHLGNLLVRQLLEDGQTVRALVLPGEISGRGNTPQQPFPLDGLNVEIMKGDILQPQSLKPAFEGVDVVYHLAGVISILPGPQPHLQRVNVEGTHNVLWAALENRVRRLVYTSSIHAFTRPPHGVQIDESLPFDTENPFGAYDRSKAQASLAVQAACRAGLEAVITCPTGVIGPYDYLRSDMGQVILDCVRRKPLLYIDGTYDFVDGRDVAQGLILAGEQGQTGASYILSGEQISVKRLIEMVSVLLGKASTLIKIPYRLARLIANLPPSFYRLWKLRPRLTPYSLEVLRSNADISHARASQELGYTPRPLRETLADTVSWFQWQYSQTRG